MLKKKRRVAQTRLVKQSKMKLMETTNRRWLRSRKLRVR